MGLGFFINEDTKLSWLRVDLGGVGGGVNFTKTHYKKFSVYQKYAEDKIYSTAELK